VGIIDDHEEGGYVEEKVRYISISEFGVTE